MVVVVMVIMCLHGWVGGWSIKCISILMLCDLNKPFSYCTVAFFYIFWCCNNFSAGKMMISLLDKWQETCLFERKQMYIHINVFMVSGLSQCGFQGRQIFMYIQFNRTQLQFSTCNHTYCTCIHVCNTLS